MNALVNAHTQRENDNSHSIRFASDASPEASRSKIGVSSDYVQKTGHQWYVLRITYNRTDKAHSMVANSGLQWYLPMHYVLKKEIGKKKRILKPLLPNLFFVYATREAADAFVKKKGDVPQIIKYYRDKTKTMEQDGKHPPMIISHYAMTNFIRVTNTESAHVRVVLPQQCHFKSGDNVRVIGGEFEGTTGKVARIAGQQRVVVEITGLCMVATAYIPSRFIEPIVE